MKKFPVTSTRTGEEYLVTIEEKYEMYVGNKLVFKLKKQGVGLFGKPRFKTVAQTECYLELVRVRFNGNYIHVVTQLVEKYEMENYNEAKQKQAIVDGKKEFEEWDGVVR